MAERPLPAILVSLLDAIESLNLQDDVIITRNGGKWEAKRAGATASPIRQLGPFGTKRARVYLSVSSTNEAGMYRIDFRKQLAMLEEWLIPSGGHGPISEVKLTDEEKDTQNIPRDATHFCWCYPPAGLTGLSDDRAAYIDRCVVAGDPAFTFLAFGGFVYFKKTEEGKLQVSRANALVQSDTGITFGGPFPWRAEFTSFLFRQGRFESVTIQSLKELGIKMFCYINPNETLRSVNGESWTPCPKGGFVYLYNGNGSAHQYDCFFPVSGTSSPSPTSPGGTSHNLRPFSMVVQKNADARKKKDDEGGSGSSSSSSSSSAALASAQRPRAPEGPREHECVVCMERAVGCIFLPCKHICTCAECGSRIREMSPACPMCREPIRDAWDVFL